MNAREKRSIKSKSRTQTAQQIADELGLSVELIRDYAIDGCPHTKATKRGQPNLFDVAEVQAWRKANNKTGKPGRPLTEEGAASRDARDRKELAMAINWELRNAQLEGELVNKEEYRQHWFSEVTIIKNKCRGLGAAIAPQLVGLDAGEIQGLLDSRIEQIFRELSEG
jgi:phage terminase Nu1 subunit (DNA packaging protein)